MSTQMFVRAAKHTTSDPHDHRTRVTGSVLHVAVGVHLPPGTGLLPVFDWLPVCGGRRSPNVEVWRITWPSAQDWPGHAHWPVCNDCERVVADLFVTLSDQLEREQQHAAQA